ncbi:CG33340 [Drosophila busckii]|uniref:CG33340 n=1 Tax=Drosophila busckii TaxID=30019 RepID=A0A0M3QYA7_DROBS|nr:uncharacterized protein LOC108602333 [Drosophila busckii]ALC47289.1 CG33340 [Drosophila busckii]
MYNMYNCLRRGLCRSNVLNAVTLQRLKSGKCGNKKGGKPKCGKINFTCGKPENMAPIKPPGSGKETKLPKPPSIWLNPFCDEDAVYCPFNPRFDDIYYVESDKAKRKYWQTWVSCPPLKMKKKKICCFQKLKHPPMRKRKIKPVTACPQPVDCANERDLKCKKLKRRCHRAGRMPPDCIPTKRPLDCTKPLTPYPSFSECTRMKPGALPLSECICWRTPMLCEAWAEWRKRSMAKVHGK